MKKQYIVRKYVMAKNAQEALRLERSIAPDECWIDDDWKKANPDIVEKPMGFQAKK